MYSYQLQCLTCPLTQSGASSYKCSSIRLWCTWRHQLTSRRHAPALTSDTQPIKEGNVLRLAIWLQAINPFYRSRWVTSSNKGTASILEADASANSIVDCKLNALSTELPSEMSKVGWTTTRWYNSWAARRLSFQEFIRGLRLLQVSHRKTSEL